jgi:hypothetical protein
MTFSVVGVWLQPRKVPINVKIRKTRRIGFIFVKYKKKSRYTLGIAAKSFSLD